MLNVLGQIIQKTLDGEGGKFVLNTEAQKQRS